MSAEGRADRSRWVEAAVVFGALLLALWVHRDTLRNPWVINNDVRQYTYGFDRDLDPALFRDDPLTDYSRAYAPAAYRLIYRALMPVVTPRQLARVLPVGLFILAAWLAFRIGRRIGGPLQGALTAAWLAACPIVLHKIAGGHPRAFAVPLLLLLLDQLGARRAWGTGLSLLLLAAFYPMAFLVAALTFMLATVRWWPRPLAWALAPRHRWLGAVAILLAVALLVVQQRATQEAYGPIVTRAEMEGHSEYGPKGPYPVLPTEPVVTALAREVRLSNALLWPDALAPGRAEARERWPIAVVSLLALLLLVGWALRRGQATDACVLLGVSVVWYLLADVLLLRLFLPERYLQYPVRVAVAVLGAWGLAQLLSRLRPPMKWTLVGVIAVSFAFKAPSLDGVGLTDFSEHRALFRFVRTLPADATVAAHPFLADEIPIFTSRKVWVDSVHAHTFYPRYWQLVASRTRGLLAAYYAAETEDVCRFLVSSGVDALVVERGDFAPRAISRRRFYFEPFHSELKAAVGNRRSFALARIPAARTVFRDGEIAVVTAESLDCARLAEEPRR